MKITSVETIELSHRLNRPTGPASVLNETRSTLIVRIATDEGLIGWGETSPLDGVRETIMGTYANALRGRDPLDAGRVWRTPWLAPFESGLAAGAVDIALHDLRGKALGVPINRLYGGGLRTSVQAYASGLCYFKDVDPADQWMDEALGLVARGFRAIKMRIGRFPPAHEVPLVARVREALPPDVRLMVDAWGSYTLPTALRVGRELQELGVYWYEEPLPQAGYHGYEVLAANLDMAIAGGEMLQTRAAFKELLDRRAVDIVQPDVSICGGIADLLFVAELARLSGIQAIPHSWNGAITEAASLHIASLLPDPTLMPGVEAPLLEYDTTENPFIEGGLREPFRMHDGRIDVPTGPGLGIELDEEWLEGHAVER
ncbi:MAG: mandelate racemase/muconate lactonizing enzyme family protein [Chloroflexi bacterium]|nr:MAG: mandelate racemase/muconate lactonizing enzyme family protein [Chloroflexota bacterium]